MIPDTLGDRHGVARQSFGTRAYVACSDRLSLLTQLYSFNDNVRTEFNSNGSNTTP